MLFHFSGTFARFAMRYERGAIAIPSMPDTQGVVLNAGKSASNKKGGGKGAVESSRNAWILGGVCAFFMAACTYYMFLPPKTDRERVDYDAIGQLTVNYGGRTKTAFVGRCRDSSNSL